MNRAMNPSVPQNYKFSSKASNRAKLVHMAIFELINFVPNSAVVRL